MIRLPALRRSAGSPSAWWASFLAGAAAGLVAGMLLGGGRGRRPFGARRDGDGEGEGLDSGDPEEAWAGRAWAGAARGLEQAREMLFRPVPLDLPGLQRRITALPSGDLVEVRDLGDGIVELVGSAADDATARALLDAAADHPGVEVVVNRVWTPSSAVPNISGS